MEKVAISSVIRNIFNERGYEIIKSPKKFCSIVDDLAFEAQKERVILRRVLTLHPDVCIKMFNLLSSSNTNKEIQLKVFKKELNEVYGVSEKWINIIIESLFNETVDNGQNKILIDSQKNDSFKTTNNETKIHALTMDRIKCRNGYIFEGETIDGKRTGKGRLIFENGDIYEGGKRTGKGRLIFENGDIYEGDFVDGKRTGKGRLIWKNGDVYEGDFVDNKRTGKGKFIWRDKGNIYCGNIYEGDFLNGKRTGKGRLIWKDGGVYEGDFVDNKRTGKGRIIWENGDVNEGDFVNGTRNGKGKDIILLRNGRIGRVYAGDYLNGKRTGKGKLLWPNGDIYEGDFADGKRTGKGRFIWGNGDIYEGDFVDGKRTGKGRFIWGNGDIYEGDFVDGNITGKGKIIWKNGDYLVSSFNNGLCINEGEYRGIDNNVFIGEMIEKPFCSIFQGRWETSDRIRYEGTFTTTFHSDRDAYVTVSNYKDRVMDIIKNGFSFTGKIIWPNGDVFEGSCKYLEPYDGEGVWHSSYGDIFDRVEKGKWKKGKMKN